VRDTEAWVRRIQSGGRTGGPASDAPGLPSADPNVSRLENELADKLGAKVAIQHSSSGRGKLIVSYHSLDELDGILAHIR
jgi:ParB family chromosome partitioning protein